MRSHIHAEILQRLQRVKLFLCDVDGVLTDASVIMGPGTEFKAFNLRDGLGLRLLQTEGIKVGWISARPSPATLERANDLKIDYLHQSSSSKVEGIEEILKNAQCGWQDIAYLGDDLVDLGAMRRAGFAAAPAGSIPEACKLAHYVCHFSGGHGAVREVADLILRAQGRWESLIDRFMQ